MKRTVLAAVAVVATLTALTANACASKAPASDARSGPAATIPTSASPTPVLTKNDCSDFTAAVKSGDFNHQPPAAGSLPPDAHPVALLKCVTDGQGSPGQGEWTVVNTVRSTGSVDAYVSALRAGYVKPPQPTPKNKNYACAAIGYVEPWVVLIDADGRAYQIKTPFWGVCPAPDPDVLKALDAVPTKVASAERIRQTVSPGAQASGCPQQYAEMAYIGAPTPGLPSGPPSGTPTPFFRLPNAEKSLSICYYKLGATPDKIKPAGDFEAATTISGSQGVTIFDALANAPVSTAKSCDAPATEYAVLNVGMVAGGGGDWGVVELSGCKLAAPASGPDRQVPDSVIQALLAARK